MTQDPVRARTARRLLAWILVLGLASAAATLVWVDRARPAVHTNRSLPAVPSSSPRAAAPTHWPAFARAAGVRLTVPAPHPVAILYHQASYPDAMRLHPLGHLVRNANRTEFRAPHATQGPDYIVMSSRGRGTPATSAVDVVLRPETPVRSPVTGRVAKAKRYLLYGRYPDWRVEIVPEGVRGVRVVLIHLEHVLVRRGDRVSVTLSVIGYPRPLSFRSQADDYVTGGDPHVHIEIKEPARTAAPPG